MVKLLTDTELLRETQRYHGTGGASQDNSQFGFIPAFIDQSSGEVYLSHHADGRIATVHLLEGLPSHLVVQRDAIGRTKVVKESIISGFVRENLFYSRDEAVAFVTQQNTQIA